VSYFTQLVADKTLGDLNEVQVQYLNDVLDGSKHLFSLLNDILHFSELKAG
jgi:signal transduction histidine kinase